jgi:hypothetical protein
MPKEKLTLTVDSQVVEKAKHLGLNISDLSELALRGFTFEDKGADAGALYEAYRDLFEAMRPLLKQYDTSVRIASSVEGVYETGEPVEIDHILLLSNGTFWSELHDEGFNEITKIPTEAFASPKEVLSNFIGSLDAAATRRKEKMKELEWVKRLVSAITSTMQGQSTPEPVTKG